MDRITTEILHWKISELEPVRSIAVKREMQNIISSIPMLGTMTGKCKEELQ